MQLHMKRNDWMDWPKVDLPRFELGGVLGVRRKRSMAEKAVDAVQDLYESAVDTVAPVVARSSKAVVPMVSKSSLAAGKAWERTSDATSVGIDRAGDTAEAVAVASVSALGAVGAFFGAIFKFVWWLITFTIKAAILAGVAYAGWQWLQSRNNPSSSWGGASSWSGTSTSGTGHNSTYGSVNPSPSTAAA